MERESRAGGGGLGVNRLHGSAAIARTTEKLQSQLVVVVLPLKTSWPAGRTLDWLPSREFCTRSSSATRRSEKREKRQSPPNPPQTCTWVESSSHPEELRSFLTSPLKLPLGLCVTVKRGKPRSAPEQNPSLCDTQAANEAAALDDSGCGAG